MDRAGGLYVGSLVQGSILHIAPGSRAVRTFAAPGSNGLVTVVGLHVTSDDQLLYACSSDPGFGKLTKTAKPALTAFRLADGAPAGRYELPAGGFCNDITELSDGTILATDSFTPRIYSVTKGSKQLKVWFEDRQFEGEGFNLNGIAATSGNVYVLRYNTGSLYRIAIKADGSAGEIHEVVLNRKLRGPDGLVAVNAKELIVVEGGGLTAGARGALTRIKLDGDTGATEMIADDLRVPTTAVVRNNTAYVVEGQLDTLFDPKAGPPHPFRILPIRTR